MKTAAKALFEAKCIAAERGASQFAVWGTALIALLGATASAHAQAGFVQDGQAGFVVADIAYALSKDAGETGACPDGMTLGYQKNKDALSAGPGGGRHPGESVEEARARFFDTFKAPNGENMCQHPEAGAPDPNFHTVTGADVPAEGIDLDGQASTAGGKPAPGTCAHNDFVGMNGEPGVDNQFFRVVGCSNSFQSTGQSNTFGTGMLTGAWGILITLKGVDDIKNDPDVEVGFYANADPIQLSPSREPLADATYAMDQDPRYRATAHGRIVDGVLTTDPTDIRFRYVVNSIRLDRPLKRARAKLTIGDDGTLEGYLAGYTPVEAMYDVQYGFRNGKDGKGDPAPLQLRLISSVGQAAVQGHTCQGAYYALYANADGDPDPKTGKCASISTQYRIKAIPAFVVDAATESVNKSLDEAGYGGDAKGYNKK